jgi:hypothetical protein
MPTYKIEPINKVQIPEFQLWTDAYGMVQDNPKGDTTGNGNLYTAQYIIGSALKGILSDRERDRLNSVYLNNFIQPGLLTRAPSKKGDMEAHDDIFGIISADKFLNPDRKLTKAIYDYGATNYCDGIDPDENKIKINGQVYGILTKLFGKVRWVWNNMNPKKFHVSAWLGRRMELIAVLQMASGVSVNPIYWAYWCATMMWPVLFPNKDDKDGYILRWHGAISCEGYGTLTNRVCSMTHSAIKRDYGDIGKVLDAYFSEKDHPLVKLLENID